MGFENRITESFERCVLSQKITFISSYQRIEDIVLDQPNAYLLKH